MTTSTVTETAATTVTVTAEEAEAEFWAEEQYVLESVAALNGDGSETLVGTTEVSADYSAAAGDGLTLIVSTSYLSEVSATKQLLDQINEILPGGYQVAEEDVFDITLRAADNSVVTGSNGLYTLRFGVGDLYNGYVLTVYIWTADGLIPYQAVVEDGKLIVSNVVIPSLVRFYIAKPPIAEAVVLPAVE